MSTPIEVVFCVDYTSSMGSDFGQIKENIDPIVNTILANHQNGNRVSLIKFRSHNDQPVTIMHEFTQKRNTFEEWLNNEQPGGGGVDGYEAVGDALREALNLQWRDNNNDEIFREKLVILITDSAPNGLFSPLAGEDPWVISNQFLGQGITLVVVGVGQSIVNCDDFYCALAQNTGGAYIPLVNAGRILSSVIGTAINDADTIHQALLHISQDAIERNSSFKYSYMKSRVDGMIKECQTMADIRKRFYNHRRSNQYSDY